MYIDIINLSKQYKEKEVLKNVSFSFKEMGKYLIKGENGIGKSTLIKAILNQILFDGYIEVNGRISFAQDTAFFPPYMKVYNFIKIISNLTEVIPEFDEKLDFFFDLLNFDNHFKKAYLGSLSKGEKQKVNLIISLLTPSDILIFDEPLSGLDPGSKSSLIKYIGRLEKMVIVVSHELIHYSKKRWNILEIENGKINLLSKVSKNTHILPIK